MLSPDSPLAPRLKRHATSVFAEYSMRANAAGAINLGQGFPDTDGPEELKQAAIRAIAEGRGNQYPAAHGIPELRKAIAQHQADFYSLQMNWETDVVVTTGASEALQAALIALVDVDDEVLVFEPWFDIYEVGVEMARGKVVGVPLSRDSLRVDFDELRKRITNRSKLLILNSPHNPTGVVWTREELQELAEIVDANGLLVLSDEAYEHLWFDDAAHIPFATLPGMWERTITVGSAGKSFSFTGWKVGWASGPAHLIGAVRVVRQHLSYVSGGPFQWAIAQGLALPKVYWDEFRADMQAKRDLLSGGLEEIGLRVLPAQGTYFVTTDVRPLGFADGADFVEASLSRAGVVAIPHARLCQHAEVGAPFVRWAFCKQPEVLTAAVEKLRAAF